MIFDAKRLKNYLTHEFLLSFHRKAQKCSHQKKMVYRNDYTSEMIQPIGLKLEDFFIVKVLKK